MLFFLCLIPIYSWGYFDRFYYSDVTSTRKIMTLYMYIHYTDQCVNPFMFIMNPLPSIWHVCIHVPQITHFNTHSIQISHCFINIMNKKIKTLFWFEKIFLLSVTIAAIFQHWPMKFITFFNLLQQLFKRYSSKETNNNYHLLCNIYIP